MKPENADFGVGATDDLTLRLSVATLVRVTFENPLDGHPMLALERKATLYAAESEGVVRIQVQPFGGAIRILDFMALGDRIGNFHFDSERSRSEQDFRIFIKPSAWKTARKFCIEHLNRVDSPVLETDPGRELAEEFTDALKIHLWQDQYSIEPVSLIVEDDPTPTQNIHAKGVPTARIYRVFEATITDGGLARLILANSQSLSDQNLHDLAAQDAKKGGKGRANAMLALDLKLLKDEYSALAPEVRAAPILYEDNWLSETVAAILDGIPILKYQRL